MQKLAIFLAALLCAKFSISQNIGIGTTNPVKGKLVVRGTAGAVSAIFGDTTTGVAIENNYPGIGINSYYNNGRNAIGNGYGGHLGMNPVNGDFSISTSPVAGTAGVLLPTSLRFLINKDGNIGLQGVTSPIMPLSFANSVGNKIALWGNNDSAHYGVGVQGSLLQMYAATLDNDIAFGYGSSVKFKENMRIKGNGVVGIGVTNPDKGKLVVRGTVGAVSAIFGDTTTGVAIENDFPGIGLNSYFNNGRKSIGNGFGGHLGINPSNGDFSISTSTAAGSTGNTLSTSLRLLVNKDGNVGLQGVSNPLMPLSFANSGGNKISLWGADDSLHYGMGIQANLMQLYTAWNGADIAFGYGSSVNFTENMRITGGGNVGIGTNTPAYPLTVNREGNGIVQKGTNVSVGTATTANAGIIKTFTNHSLQFFTGNNATPQLTLTYNGRVGIGTTTPTVKFEIKHNDFDMFQLTNTNPLASGEDIFMNFKTGNYYTGSIGTIGTSATTSRLSFASGSSLTERLSITHDGKVGINKTNPGATLEVNGQTILNPDAGSDVAAVVNGIMQFNGSAFRVTASSQNLSANYRSITIDNPICNNKPDLTLMVTSTMPNPIPFSVYYSGASNKWVIFTTGAYKVVGLANTGYTNCYGDCKAFINPILGNYEFGSGDSFNVLAVY